MGLWSSKCSITSLVHIDFLLTRTIQKLYGAYLTTNKKKSLYSNHKSKHYLKCLTLFFNSLYSYQTCLHPLCGISLFKDVLLSVELQAATPYIKNCPYFMEICHLRFQLVLVVSCGPMVACANLESSVRGGPNLISFFFSWWEDGGSKYRYKWAIIGPQAKRNLNVVSLACQWWPKFKCGLVSFVIIMGSGPVLQRNLIFIMSRPPVPPLDPPMGWHCDVVCIPGPGITMPS